MDVVEEEDIQLGGATAMAKNTATAIDTGRTRTRGTSRVMIRDRDRNRLHLKPNPSPDINCDRGGGPGKAQPHEVVRRGDGAKGHSYGRETGEGAGSGMRVGRESVGCMDTSIGIGDLRVDRCWCE